MSNNKRKSVIKGVTNVRYCPECFSQPLQIVNDHDTGWKRCAYCWTEIEKNDWTPPEEYIDFA